jgi:hypothetical protein
VGCRCGVGVVEPHPPGERKHGALLILDGRQEAGSGMPWADDHSGDARLVAYDSDPPWGDFVFVLGEAVDRLNGCVGHVVQSLPCM